MEIGAILSLLNGEHSIVTALLVGLVVVVTLWLNNRKVNIDVVTSVSKIQAENMESLLAQNKQLADDLHKVRQQQADLHEMMDTLRQQNAQMQAHIVSLETYLKHYATRCEACPNGPANYPDPPPPFRFQLINGGGEE